MEWIIDFIDTDTKEEYIDFFKDHPDQRTYKRKFETEVTTDPFFHPKHRRIKKMKGKEYDGMYRWQESNTRVQYYPNSPKQTVVVIETGTATDISYKKRSKK